MHQKATDKIPHTQTQDLDDVDDARAAQPQQQQQQYNSSNNKSGNNGNGKDNSNNKNSNDNNNGDDSTVNSNNNIAEIPRTATTITATPTLAFFVRSHHDDESCRTEGLSSFAHH